MRPKQKLALTGVLLGSLMCLAPFAGVFATALGMTRAFAVLGSSGIADSQALAAGVGNALFATVIGLVVGIVGFLLLVVSIVGLVVTHAPVPAPPPLPLEK